MPSQVSIVDLPGGGGKDEEPGKSKPGSSSAKSRPSATKQRATDNQLRDRLTTVLDRIADAAAARDDHELADVIREDRDVMATGIVSLTRPFMALRTPVLLVLAIIEPVMAFSRIGRLAVGRFFVARTERASGHDDSTRTP